jgi:hypothetical protein
VKVFFFSISFSIYATQCFIVKYLFFNIIPFEVWSNLSLCIMKNMQCYVYEKTGFVQRTLSVTHMEENRALVSRALVGFLHFLMLMLFLFPCLFFLVTGSLSLYMFSRGSAWNLFLAHNFSFISRLLRRVHNRKRRSVFHDEVVFFIATPENKTFSRKDFREWVMRQATIDEKIVSFYVSTEFTAARRPIQ